MWRVGLLALVLVACGGDGTPDDGATDASTDDVADDADDTADEGAGDDAEPTQFGSVSIQSYDAMNSPGTPTRGGSAGASFYTSGETCPVMETIGPCDVVMCSFTSTGPMSAGAITVTGAQRPITLATGGDGTYALFQSTTPLYAGGETITFAAAGAAVPAFEVALTAPREVRITSPAEPAAVLAITRSRDLSLTWTGGTTGRLQVVLYGPGQGATSLFCRFAADAGTGTIPTAALAMLEAGQGAFAMATIALAEVEAGDWLVQASAYTNAVWPDESLVSGGTAIE